MSYYYTIWDNPTLSVPEIESIRDSMSEDKWNLEYMAIESATSGIRFSEFDYGVHVSDQTMDGLTVRALDWGEAHPTVCLWANVEVENEMVYVSDEYSKTGMLIKESSEIIKAKTGNRAIEWSVIDPSTRRKDGQTGRRDMDEFARNGVVCLPADNRDIGYDIVKMFFKLNKIKIHPKCKALIHGLRTVQYGDDVGDDETDCLRYMLLRVHDYMFKGKFSKTEDKPLGYDKYKDPVYMAERRSLNLNNKYIFPDQLQPAMNWVQEEAMME
mgnify:CR=1 FL=1